MSKWLIVSDNHTESGILYQLYDYHKDADICLHLGDSEFKYNCLLYTSPSPRD